MDVQMPEMDGFEATAAIRDRGKITGGHLPIVAMTAHAMVGDRERCLEAGMDGYVAKPIQPSELFETIESLVGGESGRSQVAPTPAPGNDVIDEAALLSRVQGDAQLLKELITLFRGEYPRLLMRLGRRWRPETPRRWKSPPTRLKVYWETSRRNRHFRRHSRWSKRRAAASLRAAKIPCANWNSLLPRFIRRSRT